MKKILLILLAVPSFYLSQVVSDNVYELDNTFSFVTKPKPAFETAGSPYVDDQFKPVIIEGISKKLPKMRYNAHEDEMEFEINGAINYIVKNQTVKITFPDANKTYALTRYQMDNKEINGFLVVLSTGEKYSLFKKEIVELIVNQNNKNLPYLNEKPPQYERNKDVFLILYNNKYYKLQKNWKEVAKELSADTNEINDFIKKNKISIKDEADLINLVAFLNK